MSWAWLRAWRHHEPHLGGAAAAAAARAGLEREKARATEVHEVSEELREHRERNHFAEMLAESMRTQPPKGRRRARHRRGRPA